MATHREDLEIEKIRTEINKMIAETAKINKSLDTEINKIIAETAKINRELKYYPSVMIAGISSGMTLAIVAVVKLFL